MAAKQIVMKNLLLITFFTLQLLTRLYATGEPSTYFNIFVPPNNDPVQRNVCLIVTAIYDSTSFEIIDDGMDGDTDDSKSGILMAGQSYVLYIKDNGINDDAKYASGGVLKQDGDYFIIKSNKLVYASQSTNSDWQFDFVPSVSKSSVGQRFIVYSPPTSFSNRDLNVFAYEPNTTVTIRKISKEPTVISSKTVIDWKNASIVAQRTINPGEDIIHFYQDGRDVMLSGETYVIEANKDVSLQYGALWKNSRDGGGYAPSANGSSSGELFYFAVPYQANKEQEIRIVSWDDNNPTSLARYNNGSWINMKNWNMDKMEAADWVGRSNNATYPTVFRVTCAAGKKVSVSIANWLETGSPGTSDIATMATSKSGGTAGKEFLQYMAPPGNEQNVLNPFTGLKFNGQFTHLYLFAKDSANVTVKDAYTNGQDYSKTFRIAPGRYADCALDINEWKSIYNGDGKAESGPERPYLLVTSDANISVMNTNFNDNWMMYFGTSLEQGFSQSSSTSTSTAAPGDTVSVVSTIETNPSESIKEVSAEVVVSTGGIAVSSTFTNKNTNAKVNGVITSTQEESIIKFDSLPDINTTDNYEIETQVVLSASDNDGDPLPANTVVSVESSLIGTVSGQIQQSVSTEGISNNTADNTNLLYSKDDLSAVVSSNTDSWTSNWIDYDNDGDDDLFVTTKDASTGNLMYRNNGNGAFSSVGLDKLTSNKRISVSACWGDLDNDGDLDVILVNDTRHPVEVYLNQSGSFTKKSNTGLNKNPEYFHGGNLADIDKDGDLDLVLINYMPTKFHRLFLNDGNAKFTLASEDPISTTSNYAVSANWIDYNNDGWVDLFIPNGEDKPNELFKNIGGAFKKVDAGALTQDAENTIGSSWGDYNNDGWLDVMVTNASEKSSVLYKNNGAGSFTKITAPFDAYKGQFHGCLWVDADNDMDLDLYLTDDQSRKLFYLNHGNDSFQLKQDESLNANYGNSYGITSADYNDDGFTDIYVSTHSGDKNAFFVNNALSQNNWIKVALEGTVSNKTAIGSQVKVKANGVWQTKQLMAQDGMGGSNSYTLLFGLGSSTNIDSIVVDWPSGYKQVITAANIKTTLNLIEPNSSSISGIVYIDENNNCIKDPNELTISGATVTAGANRAITNKDGAYTIRVAAGTYNVDASKLYWSSLCGGTSVTASSTPIDYTGSDIGLSPAVFGQDLFVTVGSNYWRRGFSGNTFVVVGNNGTQTAINSNLVLDYSTGLHLVEASRASTLLNGKHIFTIDTLKPGQQVVIEIEDSVGLSKQIGETLSISASISIGANELNTTDNQFLLTQSIVGAIDPNDIQVNPEGYIASDQLLEYTIRFQNVGTFMASRVVVEDYLPSSLDYSSLEMVLASHDVDFSVTESGHCKWQFEDINLPDSTTDEQGSHGMIKFTVRPHNGVKAEDIIHNKAEIVFDYELPIITNQVENIVMGKEQLVYQLIIYPNPVKFGSPFWVATKSTENKEAPTIKKIELLDASGNEVGTRKVNGKVVDILVKEGAPGLYTILATDENGNVHVGKAIIN